MKQRIAVLILALLLSISSVFALSVELISPANSAYIYSNTVNFKCKAIGSDLLQLRLYTDISGTWAQTAYYSNPINNTELTFTINNINNGNYKWNCKIVSGSGTATAPANRTFTIDYTNNPPTFSGPIPNQTWNKDTSKNNAFDLDTYFTEPESETITYSTLDADGTIVISKDSSNVISFSQPAGWWGTDKIRFRACDPGSRCTDSNWITLTVSQSVCTESWTCTSWSTCSSGTQTRTCTDSNNCGTTVNKPATSQSCTETCEEDWECTDWSACEDETKTRSCTDNNDCGTTDDKPSETSSCSESTGSNIYSLEITSYSPTTSTVTMSKGASKSFTVETNLISSFEWYVDDKLQDETSDTFRYVPAATDIGTHSIKVIVEKEADKDAREWTVTVIEPANTTIKTTPVCGNSKIEDKEDCLTCPSDVTCKENEICDEGICKEKQQNKITAYAIKIKDSIIDKWYYSAVIGALILITILIFVFRGKKEQVFLEEFDDKKPFLSRLRARLRAWDSRRQQKKQNKVNFKKEAVQTMPTGIDEITRFINESISNGYSKRQIKRALKRKGWTRKEIKFAFKRLR